MPKVTWEAAELLTGMERDEVWSVRSLWLLQESPRGVWSLCILLGWKDNFSVECSVLVSKSIAIQTGEISSLHHECKGIYPRMGREPVAVLAIKGGFLALSPQFFKAFKQIQIPSEDWTPALWRD